MFYGEYVTVAEKKEKAEKMIEKLSKKENIEPLLYYNAIKEKAWWAKQWEDNIKNYSDFENRIARGRSYVKNGFVIDFKITEGEVNALVMGTSSKPYKINVKIDKLSEKNEKKLVSLTKNKISNLESFLKGNFPKDLEEALMDKKSGLFPNSKEIKFSCSCPDGAYMCKHVAAVLFGISSKLTENPLLFFTLRGINVEDLIKNSVDEAMEDLLKNSKKKTNRTVKEEDALDLFDL